jgi:hypothetical protein
LINLTFRWTQRNSFFLFFLPSIFIFGALTTTGKFSIGTVFDEEGNFYEEGLAQEVRTLVDRYRRRQWDAPEGGGEGKKTK